MKRILKRDIVQQLVSILPKSAQDDVPMVRQAINDACDSYRKDGFYVPDFAQSPMVSDIQSLLRRR